MDESEATVSAQADDLAQQVGCGRFLPCSHHLTLNTLVTLLFGTPLTAHARLTSWQPRQASFTTLSTLDSYAHSALLSGTGQARVQQLRLTYTAYDTHPTPGKSSRTCQQHADTAETENCQARESRPCKEV